MLGQAIGYGHEQQARYSSKARALHTALGNGDPEKIDAACLACKELAGSKGDFGFLYNPESLFRMDTSMMDSLAYGLVHNPDKFDAILEVAIKHVPDLTLADSSMKSTLASLTMKRAVEFKLGATQIKGILDKFKRAHVTIENADADLPKNLAGTAVRKMIAIAQRPAQIS